VTGPKPPLRSYLEYMRRTSILAGLFALVSAAFLVPILLAALLINSGYWPLSIFALGLWIPIGATVPFASRRLERIDWMKW
jgi:hypothetical protein